MALYNDIGTKNDTFGTQQKPVLKSSADNIFLSLS